MHFVLAFTSKMFCSFGPHRYRVAPGMASGVCVCVCVASVSLGRRLAPCCDCVYSFVTLSPALPSTHNWHCRRMERSEGKEETDRGQEQSRLISCSLSLCSLPSLVIGEIRTMSSNQCCHTQIPDLTGSSTGSAGLHRPGSSYCSVKEYNSHGALPPEAVLRSAKISWPPPPPPAAGFRVVVSVHPQGTPCRTFGCVYFRTGCSFSDSVAAICCIQWYLSTF